MTTPHAIGQNAKAHMLIADALERWALSDPADRASWLLGELRHIGWTPPPDMSAPPARPAEIADEDSPGRQAFRAAKAALAARPRNTPPAALRCQTPDRTLDGDATQVTPDLERSNT